MFGYNKNNQLVSTDLHRADTLNGVDSHEITLYEYNGRNLVTREVNALGDSTIYVYDGNGNMVSKTDADGYVTQYSYTALDLVQKINYNGAKEVSYQYNKVGEAEGDSGRHGGYDPANGYNKVGEAEGDSGELTFQGTRYLNFRREGAE